MGFLKKQMNILKNSDWKMDVFFLGITALAMLVRGALFPIVSSDFDDYLYGWYTTLQDNGGFAAVGFEIGDYTPAYLYILAFLTYLPVDPLVGIKVVSCAVDILLAYYVMQIVNVKYENRNIGLLAYCAILFLPTVILNSAAWAQCDVIFTTGLIACLYYSICDRPRAAMLGFSIAFAFKIQAIFLAPFLLVMLIKRKFKWIHFLIIPCTYLVSIVPAALGGRGIWSLLTVYFNQSQQFSHLAMNIPNLYTWLPYEGYEEVFGPAGIWLAGSLVLILLYCVLQKRFELSPQLMVSFAMVFAVLLPYTLPHMHERYFYLADVLSIVFLFYFPKKYYVPLIMIPSSLCVVLKVLVGSSFIDFAWVSVAVLILLVLLVKHLIGQVLAAGVSEVEAAPVEQA